MHLAFPNRRAFFPSTVLFAGVCIAPCRASFSDLFGPRRYLGGFHLGRRHPAMQPVACLVHIKLAILAGFVEGSGGDSKGLEALISLAATAGADTILAGGLPRRFLGGRRDLIHAEEVVYGLKSTIRPDEVLLTAAWARVEVGAALGVGSATYAGRWYSGRCCRVDGYWNQDEE